ncbi:late control protein D [Brucella sp. TWI432]
MPVPKFTISANGVDITSRLAGSGVSMTITDNIGSKSDTLNLVIDDVDGSIEAPKTGAILTPVGGYEGQMRNFGDFSVDSVVFSGFPQQITIQAKSVAAKSLAKQREPKAFPKKDYATYGDIFSFIAKQVGLELVISESIKVVVNTYEAQTEENSLEFMTRLGDKLNASITIKTGRAVVVDRGSGMTASGELLPDIIAARGKNLLSYSVSEKDEPKHSNVEASYYDRGKNEKKTVSEDTGMDGPKFVIRTPHQDAEEAKRSAKSQAKKLVRDSKEATFEINGEPFAQAGAQTVASGCRSNVDGIWSTKTVVHNFSASGAYSTSLSCTEANEKNSADGQGGSGSGGTRSSTAKKSNPSGATSRSPVVEAGVPSLTGDPGSNIG